MNLESIDNHDSNQSYNSLLLKQINQIKHSDF